MCFGWFQTMKSEGVIATIFRVHNRNVATEVEVISTFGLQGKDISLNYNMTPEIRNFLMQIYTEFWCNLRIPDYDMIIQKK